MPVSALSTITISDPSWSNARTIPASGIVATAAVNQPGSLSCVVTLDDVARLGRVDLVGAWLWYEHPTQGPFAMKIDDDPSDLDAGTVSLSCTSLGHALLMDRNSPVFLQPDTGHAGALARRALTTAQTANPLPFQSVLCDESGPQVEVEWRGEPIYDVISDLVNQTGQEWDCPVDTERNLSFVLRERIGADKSHRVLICEGYHVAGGHIDHSRLSVTNDITGIAADEDWARSTAVRIENEPSLARYGLRQAIRRYNNAVSPLTVKAKVRADIRAEGTAPHLPTITLPAMLPVCNEIRHGDTLRYWSRSRNRELLFRVISRTVRDGAVLELAGIADEVSLPPVVAPFTPDLLSGLLAWVDASDVSTLTIAGGVVTQIRDKSPFADTLIDPTFNSATYDTGNKIIHMGTAGYFRGTLNPGAAIALTMIAVARPVDAFAGRLIGYPEPVVGVAVDPEANLGVNGSAKVIASGYQGGVLTSTFLVTAALSVPGNLKVLSATFDRSLSTNEVTAWVNGVSTGTRPNNGNMTGSFTSTQAWALNPSWDVAEVLIYKGSLTTTQRQAVEGYLTRKWSLA